MKKYITYHTQRAFTLVELIVSISIFAVMTALVVANYGTFNQSVLLTNLAYDVALTIRTAQTYGLSVRNADSTPGNPNDAPEFDYAYGVHFSKQSGSNTEFTLFADFDGDKKYDSGEAISPSPYTLKRGAYIQELCTDSDCNSMIDELNITFKRPDPNAYMCSTNCSSSGYTQGVIVIAGTDGSVRVISVRKNGQIAVLQ